MDSSDAETENQNEHVFDMLQSKTAFLGLADVYCRKNKFGEQSIHLTKYIQRQTVISANKLRKAKGDYLYTFVGKDSGIIIMVQDKASNALEVLSFEGIFDVLMAHHIENDHGPIDVLEKDMKTKYIIPNVCYYLILEACTVCRRNMTIAKALERRTANIYFIPSMNLKDSNIYNNSMMIYFDVNTEFLLLRPLHTPEMHDAAADIFKIFMEIGPPGKIMLYLRDLDHVKVITDTINMLVPNCIVKSKKIIKEVTVACTVMNAIGAWMKDEKSTSWELGCSVVQRRFNTEIRIKLPSGTPVSSHDLFFRNPDVMDEALTLYSGKCIDANPTTEPYVYIHRDKPKVPRLSDCRRKNKMKKIEEDTTVIRQKITKDIDKLAKDKIGIAEIIINDTSDESNVSVEELGISKRTNRDESSNSRSNVETVYVDLKVEDDSE